MSHASIKDDAQGLNGDMPSWLKWTMTFINRVGFPIVVCIFLAWLCIFKMDENRQMVVDALKGNTNAILLLKDAVIALNK